MDSLGPTNMSPYRTPAPPPMRAPTGERPELRGAIAALLTIVGVVALIAASRAARHPLAELPHLEREQLLARTLENLALCERHPDDALQAFCSAQAEIARALPECDESCRVRARPRRPTRSPNATP